MIEVRFALPQRSPSPFSVPCNCRAPARTAASVLATAFSVSLWAWMPTRSRGICRTTAATMASTSCGSVPPFVSHKNDPARARVIRRFRTMQRIDRIGLIAVEEMLAVDQRLAPGAADRLDRGGDGFEVLFARDAERNLDVIVPGLRHEAHGIRAGL